MCVSGRRANEVLLLTAVPIPMQEERDDQIYKKTNTFSNFELA